jgi:hypothetical protein
VFGDGASSGHSSFDQWRVIPAGTVLSSHWEDREIELTGDAILLEKSESASVAVFWDGQSYRTYVLTD